MNAKKWVRAVALTVVGANALPAGAQVLGETDVTLLFPGILILNYPSALTLDLTQGGVQELPVIEAPATIPPAEFGGTVTVDAGLTGTTDPATPPPSEIIINVENAWALRGIATGNINVVGTVQTADGTNGTSTVTLTDVNVASGGAFGDSVAVAPPGFFTPTLGDVQLVLDPSGLTTPAAHTGIQYRITASAP